MRIIIICFHCRVIAEKVPPPKEFSLLSRTADTDQKAWRKRQIAYKLSKRGTVTHAVTDIILCSKLKIAPDGFKLAGDINGVLICYKTGAIPVRLPPPVPGSTCEVEQALNRLNLRGSRGPVGFSFILLNVQINIAMYYLVHSCPRCQRLLNTTTMRKFRRTTKSTRHSVLPHRVQRQWLPQVRAEQGMVALGLWAPILSWRAYHLP